MRRRLWLMLCVALAIGLGGMLWAGHAPRMPARAEAERPDLLLLTSLPLMFAERFGLDQPGSPALAQLERRYRVTPIAVADPASLSGHGLLLMAQPRAQPAEALVALDTWVRQGGRLVLLADPRLDWPSERPLGDLSRPQPAFADTGLLAHWGLTLFLPGDGATTGSLASRTPACQLRERGLMARCHIGKGQATVIADADFLKIQAGEAANLDPLLNELARLESR